MLNNASRQVTAVLLGASLCFILSGPPAVADDDAPVITPRHAWSNVFGAKQADVRFIVKSPRELKGRVGWSFTANQRTIAQGESKLAVEANQPANVDIRLPVPPVKEGVVFAAMLTIKLFADGQEKAEATLEKPIWIFPQDPFHERAEWLKELKITLFDPEKKTAQLFDKLKIPCDETQNAASLDDVTEGTLLIGEGVSFKEHAELPERLLRAAARGVPVLCLAPAQGTLALPGIEPKLPQPVRVDWRRADVIPELDKRLDHLAWAGAVAVTASSVSVKADEGKVVGEVVKGDGGWAWLDAHYPKKGRLIVCGFGVIGPWESGPTPRFLFARVLETLTRSDKQASTDKETAK